ncbi:MAG: hypothetical protein WDA59_08050 [Methanofastidiosum sp.]|jgi:hypothetical protein
MDTNKSAVEIILELLRADGSIVINKKLVKTIGLQAAILYSELLSKYLYFQSNNSLDKDGYFYNSVDNIKNDTTLSKFQQGKAIAKLVKLGLIEYDVRGLPATRYFKITENNNIIKLLSAKKEMDTKMARNLPTSWRESGQLDGEKVDSNNTNLNNTNNNTNNIYTPITNPNQEDSSVGNIPTKNNNRESGNIYAESLQAMERKRRKQYVDKKYKKKENLERLKEASFGVTKVFNYWKDKMGYNAELTEERERLITERLAEGFTIEQCIEAINSCYNSPWHMGKNPNNTKYNHISNIFKDNERLQSFLGHNYNQQKADKQYGILSVSDFSKGDEKK